jgi:hypothetical protein
MALNMMKELMFWVLDRYLSRYIRNIDQVSLKGSLWRGHVRLGGQKGPLEIKPEALAAENLPVQVVFGVLGKPYMNHYSVELLEHRIFHDLHHVPSTIN